MDAVDLALAVYAEHAAWARHYDTIRVGISSFLVAIVGALLSQFFLSKRKSVERKALLFAALLIGFVMTSLSALYTVHYQRTSHSSFEMLKQATKYREGLKDVTAEKFTRKVQQKYLDGIKASGVTDVESLTACHWVLAMLKMGPQSVWVWVNALIGLVTPLALLIWLFAGRLRQSAH